MTDATPAPARHLQERACKDGHWHQPAVIGERQHSPPRPPNSRWTFRPPGAGDLFQREHANLEAKQPHQFLLRGKSLRATPRWKFPRTPPFSGWQRTLLAIRAPEQIGSGLVFRPRWLIREWRLRRRGRLRLRSLTARFCRLRWRRRRWRLFLSLLVTSVFRRRT